MRLYFSDYFAVAPSAIRKYGAFNISLLTDLPLFIDPFLLFNSRKPVYRRLHDEIVRYLRFLKDKAAAGAVDIGLIDAWYRFPEVEQTWLGFSEKLNRGRGLGRDFARALHENLQRLFRDFGEEQITQGSHLEKLCLIKDGVGKDNISDFTTNLILGFLYEYTQTFAQRHIAKNLRRRVRVPRARFNYQTESWEAGEYDLPWQANDFVLLSPRDVLTKDDTWINKTDLIDDFRSIPDAISNGELRAQINNYFLKQLPKKPKKKDERIAAIRTLLEYPELIDYYIRHKEERGDQARSLSEGRVRYSQQLYVQQFSELPGLLSRTTEFYTLRQRQ